MNATVEADLPSLFEFIRNGMNVKQSKDEDGLPITRIETISNGEVDARRFGYAGLSKSDAQKWLLRKGDILFSHINSVEHIGKCALFDGGYDLVHGMNLLCFRPRLDRADPNYLKWLFRSEGFRSQIMPFVNKAVNQASISIGNLSSLRVKIPPLEEQKRIAAILDQADELRRKRQRALDRLNQLGQAIFIEMFGDPLGSTSQLPVVEFSDVVRRITYGFTCPMSHMDSGIPIITAKNVRDGWIDLDKVHYADRMEFDALTAKSKPEPGDILITKDGTIGRCAIVGEAPQLCINQSVALIQPRHDLVSSTYLLAYLMTPRVQQTFRGMKKGNAIAHLQITELARLSIPTPSLLEQAKFEAHMMTAAATKRRLEEAASKSDALFTSLQHRAFRGELTVSSLKEAAA